VLCPYPHIGTIQLRDKKSELLLTTKRTREAAVNVRPDEEVVHNPVQGHEVEIVFEYLGGEPGNHSIKWHRINKEGQTVVAVQTTSYHLDHQDKNCQLRVEIVPRRADGAEGCPVDVFTGYVGHHCTFSYKRHAHVMRICPYELSTCNILHLKKLEEEKLALSKARNAGF